MQDANGSNDPESFEIHRQSKQLAPILFIDVNISPTQTERISIYDGDTPHSLASAFCEEHNLPEKMQKKLI